ncbi:MAG: hypothetical protein AB7O97_06095 [Planctomycetota bacterium]
MLIAPGTAMPAQQIVQTSAIAGSTVAAGDVDDDGYGDILQFAATWQVLSGRTGLALPHLSGLSQPGALRSDLDADGCADLYDLSSTSQADLLSGATGAVLFSFASSAQLLTSVVGVGDVDRDGHDDVMVHGIDLQAPFRHATMLSGRDGHVILHWQLINDGYFSSQVQPAGDQDGDGHPDLLQVDVGLGSASSSVRPSPLWNPLPIAGSPFGVFATPVGDTDGDGRDEVHNGQDIVDAPSGQVLWTAPSVVLYPVFDLDGDGARDFWNATNAIVSGRTQTPIGALGTTALLQTLGDIDADGRDDLAAGGFVWQLAGGAPSGNVRTRGGCGSTSSSSSARMTTRLRPRLGDTMLVDLRGAGPGRFAIRVLGTAADTDLAPFGAPGNRALVVPIVADAFPADGDGFLRTLLPVPTAAALLGQSASMQWAVLDPAANALGIVASNAVDLTVGS